MTCTILPLFMVWLLGLKVGKGLDKIGKNRGLVLYIKLWVVAVLWFESPSYRNKAVFNGSAVALDGKGVKGLNVLKPL